MEVLHLLDMAANRITADHLCYQQLEISGFRLHSHDTWEILFIKKGCVSYMVEGRCYSVEGGTCILTRPGVRHTVCFRDVAEYDRYSILFQSPLFDILPESLEVINLAAYTPVQELFSRMDFYAAYLDGELLETALVNLVEEVILHLKIIQEQQTVNYTANPIIMDAIAYIDRHLDEDIPLEQLCYHLHVTKSYLNRLFITHLQLPPAKYITAKRLNKARMMIRSGAKPTAVCEISGFQDYCTFYRNYVRHFGYAPSEEQSHPPISKIEW